MHGHNYHTITQGQKEHVIFATFQSICLRYWLCCIGSENQRRKTFLKSDGQPGTQYLPPLRGSDHGHKLWAVSCYTANQVEMNKSRFEMWVIYLYHQASSQNASLSSFELPFACFTFPCQCDHVLHSQYFKILKILMFFRLMWFLTMLLQIQLCIPPSASLTILKILSAEANSSS
jgi:hypothetical protein